MFECTITLEESKNKDIAEANINALGWQAMIIYGDLELGRGVRVYARKRFNKAKLSSEVRRHMTETAMVLTQMGFNVVRQEIKLVLYDTENESNG